MIGLVKFKYQSSGKVVLTSGDHKGKHLDSVPRDYLEVVLNEYYQSNCWLRQELSQHIKEELRNRNRGVQTTKGNKNVQNTEA